MSLRHTLSDWWYYFNKAGVVVLVIVMAGVAAIYAGASSDINRAEKEMRQGYQAWVKQTDNPKALTYEEWRALIRLNAMEASK